LDYIKKILADYSINSEQHPDLLYFKTDSKLGIEQARKIKEHFSIKPHTLKGKIAVLEDASTLTLDAQNALLKLMEELPTEGVLILGAPSDSKFLPTVLSRCQVIRIKGEELSVKNEKQNEIELLLNATLEERFEYIEKLKEKEEFLHSLVSFFHQKLPANHKFVKQLLQAEEYANQNVNIRAILEYLMLNLPLKPL
jgi:DNA polymerase III delta prime subunit